MATQLVVSTTFKAKDQVTAAVRRMTRSVTTFSQKAVAGFRSVQRAESKLRKGISKSIGKLGQLGLAFSGLMIAQQIATANIDLEQSMASLQAITGATEKQMISFASQVERVSKAEKIFGADTAAAFELVGSAKPELLASAKALGEVTQQAILLGKAGKLETVEAVNALTGSLNQFMKGADSAAMFTDILATAQQKGAGNIAFLSQAMVNAGGTSKAFGNSFADTVAILEGFAKAGVPASEAGTQLAGILAKLSTVQNKNFNPQFTKATDIIDNLAKANLSYTDLIKLTDVRGAKWLTTIINQNKAVQDLTGNLNEVGNAQAQAGIQTSTLGTKLKEVTAAFKNATSTTDSNNVAMNAAKKILESVANNMESIIGVIGTLLGAFIAYKAMMIGFNIVMTASSIIQGIYWAFQKTVPITLGANAIAVKAYTVVQWLMNAAVTAGGLAMQVLLSPITLVVTAIALLVSIVASFIRNWEMVKQAFKTGGILEGIKAIGKVLFDSLLLPIQKLLELLSKLPVIGDKIAPAVTKIQGFREGLGLNVGEESEGPLNAEAEIEKVRTERIERTNNSKISLDINNNSGLDAKLGGDLQAIPINLTNTNSWPS
jgi:TP901 family phage tail tape measure protein